MVDILEEALSKPVISFDTTQATLDSGRKFGIFTNAIPKSQGLIIKILNWKESPDYDLADSDLRHDLSGLAQVLNAIAVDHTASEQEERLKEDTAQITKRHPQHIDLFKRLGFAIEEIKEET